MMSNNIITQTYGNNLRIRRILPGGYGGGPGGGGGGCGDDCPWGMNPVLYIVTWFFISLSSFYLLYFLGAVFYYYFCRAEAVDVARERVHCSDTKDDVL